MRRGRTFAVYNTVMEINSLSYNDPLEISEEKATKTFLNGQKYTRELFLTLLIINDVQGKIKRDLCHLPDGPERKVWTRQGYQAGKGTREWGSLINARESENWCKYVPKI